MLISCPECNLNISDKAVICPHCGYPLKPKQIIKQYTRKRLRLSNGFGEISEIKNQNLRKRFRVRINVGKDPYGKPIKQILKPVGYFETYQEAYEELLKYNQKKLGIHIGITLKEVYDEMYSEMESKGKISFSIERDYLRGIKRLTDYWNTPISQLRVKPLKDFINSITDSEGAKYNTKRVLTSILDYAVENEYIEDNPAKKFTIEMPKVKKHHDNFSDSEIETLWKASETDRIAAMILINCYMGWRPSEMLSLTTENISEDGLYAQSGSKTKAGKNRIVPIHPRIKELFYSFCSHKDKLFEMDYNQYKYRFGLLMKKYGLDETHKPHDCRVQFVSMAKKYNVDEYAIKRIVGHKIDDLTENIYTVRDKEWLKSEIEKIL